MPWKSGDVDRHKKGLSPLQKRAWVKTANAVLKKTGDDGQAIRVANANVRKHR